MWLTFQDAKTWSVRPSILLNLQNDYVAYCFDQAVSVWGNHVIHELDKIEGKTEKEVTRKRQNKLLQLLDAPDAVRFKPLRKPTKKK